MAHIRSAGNPLQMPTITRKVPRHDAMPAADLRVLKERARKAWQAGSGAAVRAADDRAAMPRDRQSVAEKRVAGEVRI
jgi:hypothetical protein